jgi:hypothetical protein
MVRNDKLQMRTSATEPFFRAWYVQYPRYFYVIFQPRFFFFTPSYPQKNQC